MKREGRSGVFQLWSTSFEMSVYLFCSDFFFFFLIDLMCDVETEFLVVYKVLLQDLLPSLVSVCG